jgi:hypothetical protein
MMGLPFGWPIFLARNLIVTNLRPDLGEFLILQSLRGATLKLHFIGIQG